MVAKFKSLFGLVFGLLAAGCVHQPPKSDFDAHIEAVDRLAQIHEEYGSITLSPPILVPPGDIDYFKFDLPDQNAETYFKHAKEELQGRAAVLNSHAETSSMGVNLEANLDQLTAGSELWSQYFAQKNDYYRKKAAYESGQGIINNIKLDAARRKLQLALEEAQKKNTDAERMVAMDAAYAQFAQEIPQPQAPGDPPKPLQFDNSQPPAVDNTLSTLPKEARAYLQAEKFANQLGLLGNDSGAGVVNRDRAAIITASGDNTVEGILRVLGEANKAQKFKDKIVIYGVSMVSVQPGWRTKHDFEANLTVQASLDYQKARESLQANAGIRPSSVGSQHTVEDQSRGGDNSNAAGTLKSSTGSIGDKSSTGSIGDKFPNTSDDCKIIKDKPIPAIAAVSPMTDIQNLDVASSQRQAIEKARRIGLALSLFGVKLGASAFNDYVQQLQSDIRTRTPQVPIAAYSNGGIFGYRVGPSVAALTQPGNPNSTSGELLQKQSFPVLLIIGLDQSDLKLEKVEVKDKNGKITTAVCEPSLKIIQSPSWIPMNESATQYRLSETTLIDLSEKTPAFNSEEKRDEKVINSRTTYLADVRQTSLRAIVFGSMALQNIPEGLFPEYRPPKEQAIPEVEKIFVADITQSKDKKKLTGHLVIMGRELGEINLGKIAARALQGTKGLLVIGMTENNGILEANFEIDAKGGDFLLRLPLKNHGKKAVLTPPIKIAPVTEGSKTQKDSKPNDSPTVIFSTTQGKDTSTHRLEFHGKVNNKTIEASRDVIKSELEKAKPVAPPPASK